MGRLDAWSELADDSGFTLLELLIVTTTIALLIAIAVPMFKQSFRTTHDRAAQLNLRNAYKVAKVAYFDQSSFDNSSAAALTLQEPALTFSTGGNSITADPKPIFVSNASGATWLAVSYSASGSYYGIAVTAGEGVGRCKSTSLATAKAWTVSTCNATTW